MVICPCVGMEGTDISASRSAITFVFAPVPPFSGVWNIILNIVTFYLSSFSFKLKFYDFGSFLLGLISRGYKCNRVGVPRVQ